MGNKYVEVYLVQEVIDLIVGRRRVHSSISLIHQVIAQFAKRTFSDVAKSTKRYYLHRYFDSISTCSAFLCEIILNFQGDENTNMGNKINYYHCYLIIVTRFNKL